MKPNVISVTLKDGRKIPLRMPSDEESAAIAAAAASDPDCPVLTDEEWEQVKPRVMSARAFFSPEKFAALTDKRNPVRAVPVTDAEHAARMEAIRKRGRPPLDNPKEQINIRLDAPILAAFRATGRGWQTRINEVLGEAVAAGRV